MSRCVCLDNNGRRCRRKATHYTHYFGDTESNMQLPTWVVVELCEQHAVGRARKIRGNR